MWLVLAKWKYAAKSFVHCYDYIIERTQYRPNRASCRFGSENIVRQRVTTLRARYPAQVLFIKSFHKCLFNSMLVFSTLQPPSDDELSVTSGILGRLHKWKNESTVSRWFLS